MEGDYFSWLSHDDLYTEEKISKQVSELNKCEDKTTIVNCGYQVVDSQGKWLYDMDPFKRYKKEQLDRPLFALLRGCVHGCSLLIHRSHFKRAGVFDTNLPSTQDYDLWFRIMRGHKILTIEGLYVKSRCHDEQGSKKLIDSHIKECTDLWLNMITSLSENEKCQIDGSLYLFYYNTRKYLMDYSSYYGVIEKLNQYVLLEAKKEWLKSGKDIYLEQELGACVKGAEYLAIARLLGVKKERNRIAFLLPLPNAVGGLDKVVHQIASQLCKYYEVILVSTQYGKPYYYLDNRVIRITLPSANEDLKFLSKALFLIETDICIISHNCDKYWLSAYKELKFYGIKSIAWSHEFYFLPYWNPMLFSCLESRNKALSQADAVIWLNSYSANAYALLHDNAVVVHNPVTIEIPRELPDNRPKNIIAMSRFDDPIKGLRELLYVFSIVVKKCPEASLYILGSYDLEQIVPNENITYSQLICKLDLPNDRLHFLGWVDDIKEYLFKARIHLMLSKYEGFGLVITEAAAYGIPSIVFSGSGLDDIINDGVDGRIIPRGDIRGMANAVVELLENDNLYQHMSTATLNIIDKFQMDKVLFRWKELIEIVLSKSGKELNNCLKQNFMLPVKNEKEFIKQFAMEYENSIIKLASNPSSPSDYYYYKNEYEKMLRTFSWRITKPLRFVRKVYLFYKNNGFAATLKRITWKLTKR
jgi:glycosyltransferase involved in cell wall biosynthesis